jgi:hypothetical protein
MRHFLGLGAMDDAREPPIDRAFADLAGGVVFGIIRHQRDISQSCALRVADRWREYRQTLFHVSLRMRNSADASVSRRCRLSICDEFVMLASRRIRVPLTYAKE